MSSFVVWGVRYQNYFYHPLKPLKVQTRSKSKLVTPFLAVIFSPMTILQVWFCFCFFPPLSKVPRDCSPEMLFFQSFIVYLQVLAHFNCQLVPEFTEVIQMEE